MKMNRIGTPLCNTLMMNVVMRVDTIHNLRYGQTNNEN